MGVLQQRHVGHGKFNISEFGYRLRANLHILKGHTWVVAVVVAGVATLAAVIVVVAVATVIVGGVVVSGIVVAVIIADVGTCGREQA